MDEPSDIRVAYRTWAALGRDAATQLSQQGLFLKIDLALPQFAKVRIHLVLPDETTKELPAEVVTVVPGAALAVAFGPAARPALEEVLAKAASNPAEGAPPDDDPEVGLSGAGAEQEPADEDAGPAPEDIYPDQIPLQQQIDAMSVAEKRQHALHGRKDMRMLLIRDRNKALHPFVLQNPGITLDEIEQIARMTSVNPDVLHTIAKSRDFTRSAAVVRNLVRNPKTPMPDALALLEKLPLSEIRVLAKAQGVRGPVQTAARKKIASQA